MNIHFCVQGPDGRGYITQPFTGPDISNSPQQAASDPSHPLRPEDREATPRSRHTTAGAPVTNYIPGLYLDTLKTKKRRKKKTKSKPPVEKSKIFMSSSDSDTKGDVRETMKDIEPSHFNDDDFEFEAPDAINEIEIKLTDDLTNSLVNPPVEDFEFENEEIAEEITNFTKSETAHELPTNIQCSYSEAVSKSLKEVLLNLEESTIPTDVEVQKSPEKPSNVKKSKSKNKSRKKKPKVTIIEIEKTIESPAIQIDEEENTENTSGSVPNCPDLHPDDTITEPIAISYEAQSETEVEASSEVRLRPHRRRKRKVRERQDQSPVQRVLVVDEQV